MGRQKDVRVRFVIAQQNVVFRAMLLDQVMFKYQRLSFCEGHSDLDISNITDKRSRFGTVYIRSEIRAEALFKVFGFTYINDSALTYPSCDKHQAVQ